MIFLRTALCRRKFENAAPMTSPSHSKVVFKTGTAFVFHQEERLVLREVTVSEVSHQSLIPDQAASRRVQRFLYQGSSADILNSSLALFQALMKVFLKLFSTTSCASNQPAPNPTLIEKLLIRLDRSSNTFSNPLKSIPSMASMTDPIALPMT